MGQPGFEARPSSPRVHAQNHCGSMLSNAVDRASKMKTEKVCCSSSMKVLAVLLRAVSWVKHQWVKVWVRDAEESRPPKYRILRNLSCAGEKKGQLWQGDYLRLREGCLFFIGWLDILRWNQLCWGENLIEEREEMIRRYCPRGDENAWGPV